MARVDDLKSRVSELEQQLQETKQEVNTHTSRQTVDEIWYFSFYALRTTHPYSERSGSCCFTFECLFSWMALGGVQTLTPYLSLGGDGASPAAGREASRAGAGGG